MQRTSKPFVNPLTQNTSKPSLNHSLGNITQGAHSVILSDSEGSRRKGNKMLRFTQHDTSSTTHKTTRSYEETHERITIWIDKSLKKRFEKLVKKEGKKKAVLLDEAIIELLNKYSRYS